MIKESRALRNKLLSDPHRPGYHFVTPEGRCGPFDPNGAIFWNGRYHLMYIFQEDREHYWGHASSLDLVHWRHHPPSLAPGEGDRGIFSGGAFADEDGKAVITYWGLGDPRGICIATSTDENLDTWTKSPHNPVIVETAPGYTALDDDKTVYGAADPSAIWRHDGRYYMLTGNLLVLNEYGRKRKKAEHLGDTLYLFVSDDLARWTYLHRFYQSDRKWTQESEDDMCPDFFALPSGPEGGPASDRHMILFISHNLGCQYYVGRYADDRFEPETHGRMTWVDNGFFAPESLQDDRGRRIMWSWIFDQRDKETREASDWSGTMSLPRLLWLGEDKTLRMRPAPELEALRYNPKGLQNLAVAADAELPLEDIRGNSIELSVDMVPGDAAQCGVAVCRSPGGEEQTRIFYDAADKALKIDTHKSSLGEGPKKVEAAPFTLEPGETLSLHIFVDKSVIEVFANDRQAVSRRVYPTRADSLGIALFSAGAPLTVPRLRAWTMMPSNPY
jgi:beta-fructofuranosidase